MKRALAGIVGLDLNAPHSDFAMNLTFEYIR